MTQLIDELAEKFADAIIPPEAHGDGFIVSNRNPLIRELLIEFAAEVKRSAVEP